MGADLVSFYFRYKDINPSNNWRSKAEKVAEYIQRIYGGNGFEDSFLFIKDFPEEYKAVRIMDYDVEIDENYCSCDCGEFFGDIDCVIENIKSGMIQHFPEFIWELHRYIEYGDVIESISGYDGKREYGGCYEVLCCDEEEDEEDEEDSEEEDEGLDFSVPEVTEENPYPCPEYVRGDYYDGFERYWLNPALR